MAAAADREAAHYRVLVVCTANICRSVMAEALLAHHADAADTSLGVSSAGFLFDGEASPPHTVAVMTERGLDVAAHRSRIVTPEIVREHDLVVTMERRHARRLSLTVPEGAHRIATLAGLVGPLAAGDGPDLETRLARIHRDRGPAALLGSGPDEVADPFGRSRREYRRCADQLDALTAALHDALRLSG